LQQTDVSEVCGPAAVVTTLMITNVAVEWLALLLHIQEVLGSNLSPETGYPD
jgi:hypothetical protein